MFTDLLIRSIAHAGGISTDNAVWNTYMGIGRSSRPAARVSKISSSSTEAGLARLRQLGITAQLSFGQRRSLQAAIREIEAGLAAAVDCGPQSNTVS
ncbi:MAG: hypothetical protein HOL85_14000 [Rhodospirillaceae bacterium]|jgi:hypothetical protein|nr:hypothetical protein [Rhodospirillaceae bacterium]MBT6138424.1 hypothetical protein [Rhodospirillaceae bacterium]